MTDTPGWIQLLFKRSKAESALHSAFLYDLNKANILEEINARPNGPDELRQVALGELDSADPETLAMTLVFLSIVGKPEDLRIVGNLQLADHSSELVRRAAKTCLFDLRHADSG